MKTTNDQTDSAKAQTPWKALNAKNHSTNEGEKWVAIQAKGTAFDLTFPPIVSMEEAQRIGNLTAAAPDLLAALEGMLTVYTDFVNSGDGGSWNPETDTEVIEARDAIARATLTP